MENLLETERKDTSMYSKHAEPVKKSYTETKAMGCTDIVYWDGEPQTNPKTGNEFFAPECKDSLRQS